MVVSRSKLVTGNEAVAAVPNDETLIIRSKSASGDPAEIDKEILDSIYELDKLGILDAENVILACVSKIDIVRFIHNKFEGDLDRLSKDLSNFKKCKQEYENSLQVWRTAERKITDLSWSYTKKPGDKYWSFDEYYTQGAERIPGLPEYNYRKIRYVQKYRADADGGGRAGEILDWEKPDPEDLKALKMAYEELVKAYLAMTKFPLDIADQIQNLMRMNPVIGEALALLVHRELQNKQPSHPSPPTQIDFQLGATVVEKDKVLEQLRQFVAARDWKQFHTPENLAKSVSIEAAELLELFQWGSEADEASIKDELADILTYCILLADHFGLDPYDLVIEKLEKTKEKYPVEKSKGKSDKYDRL